MTRLLADHGYDLVKRPTGLRRIVLTSCGGRFLPGCRVPWKQETWIWEHIKDGVEHTELGRPDHAVLVTDLVDPKKGSLRLHTGTRPNIIEGVVMNVTFIDLVREIKRAVFWAPCETVHIALLCMSGRHRSVAMTHLLKHVISAEYPDITVETHHASKKQFWKSTCGGSDFCTRCAARIYSSIQEIASLVWRSV